MGIDWDPDHSNEYVIGVLISQQHFGNTSALQLTIGYDQSTGDVGITEPYSYGDPGITYSVASQDPTTLMLRISEA